MTSETTISLTKTPYRQIRAEYDETTITVYQAYNAAIASAAVEAQKLDASPLFRKTRMTWIKPSWAWMLYRAGYSYKDKGQERILALRMKHDDFTGLLEKAVLTHGGENKGTASAGDRGSRNCDVKETASGASSASTSPGKSAEVKVQWDPERTVRLGRLEHRSIQIGIPAAVAGEWVGGMIVSIEDVTEKARELKRVLDERADVSLEELRELGLVPDERVFEVSKKLKKVLKMTEKEGEIS